MSKRGILHTTAAPIIRESLTDGPPKEEGVAHHPRSGWQTADDTILNKSETAAMTGLSVRTLERGMGFNDGRTPPYVRMGPRRIGYRLGAIRAWVRAHTHTSLAAELSGGLAQ